MTDLGAESARQAYDSYKAAHGRLWQEDLALYEKQRSLGTEVTQTVRKKEFEAMNRTLARFVNIYLSSLHPMLILYSARLMLQDSISKPASLSRVDEATPIKRSVGLTAPLMRPM